MRDGIRKETLGAPAATGRLRPCRRGGGGAAVPFVARAPVTACRGVTSLREERLSSGGWRGGWSMS